MANRRPSETKRGGYQGSSDPGEPTKLMQSQVRPVGQGGEEVVLYRVDVVDRRTMRSEGVAVLATCDVEAFDAIRAKYPRDRYDVVDRETGEEVDLDER